MLNIEINLLDIVLIICTILSLLYSIFVRIQYLCLKRASEFIASVEEDENLSGKDKFNKVNKWINDELPILFKSETFNILIEKAIQFAYDNAVRYMKNYIKRKTGYSVSRVVEHYEMSNSKILANTPPGKIDDKDQPYTPPKSNNIHNNWV